VRSALFILLIFQAMDTDKKLTTGKIADIHKTFYLE
jgi:hypothetical protein